MATFRLGSAYETSTDSEGSEPNECAYACMRECFGGTLTYVINQRPDPKPWPVYLLLTKQKAWTTAPYESEINLCARHAHHLGTMFGIDRKWRLNPKTQE